MELGRIVILFGVVLVMIGGVVLLLGRAGLHFGRLPGDIVYRGKNTTVYFPLASGILVSVVASLIFYVIGKLKH